MNIEYLSFVKHFQGFLNTNPLWKQEQFGLKQFVIPEIDLTTFTPQPIPQNLRLGHQIEYIFHQLLEHSNTCDILAHNIQIKKGNDTLGELDFLIRFRESKQLLHLELTYKFYIIDPNIPEPIHRLMGPNRKDAFFAKLEKTKQKQLPLVYSKEGLNVLQTLAIEPSELQQEVLFLGQLFTPYNTKIPSITPLNSACIVGFWIQMHDFESLDFKQYQYYIAPKNAWVHTPHLEVDWISYTDILTQIAEKHLQKRTPIVWIKKENDFIDKCFVVWW